MISRRIALGSVAAAFTSACGFGRMFHLHWDEEVQTSAGTLVAALRYTYESLSSWPPDRYSAAILRETQLSFDAGPGIGPFSRMFNRHRVDLIERVGDAWYIVLETRGGPPYETLPDGRRQQIWGNVENAVGQKCWRLDEHGFDRASLLDLPENIKTPNLLMDYAPVDKLAKLNGQRVTLAMKAGWNLTYPVSPPAGKIVRPMRRTNP